MARGRRAKTPTDIPATGWKDIIFRVKDELSADRVGLIAAGIAFYALLSLFPAITALMALSGLLLDPADVTSQIEAFASAMPDEAAQIILDQAVAVAGSHQGGLSLALIIGVGLALYSASKGMSSLMDGLNAAYDEDESRGFVVRTATTLGLTLFLVLGLVVGLAAAMAVPAVLNVTTMPSWLETVVAALRWLLLGALTIFGIAVLYRYGPSRDNAEWQWLSPGAVVACVLWLVGSVGFSIYVANFGSYNETFGSMAGVIILLLWLWLSAYIILLGAELNAEMEAQTRYDTTVGEDEPMGRRGARKADRLGKTASAN
ncbi:YihY/virulence factor BrkB family protein [uncultured Roseobacter sp.]|uniref:YihY/virulence factor BrkB family protein n=1 Tax=uncultured Roseobacter sp. TaxID=114847 RepID=UPI002626B189|nr:YihY/virulence factor BrkB family protein [uncultured Roseobacter sp.]